MTDDAADTDTYALKSATLAEIAAPDITYEPPAPAAYRPRIGMIGTGGISVSHLDAYRAAGWDVAALWNRTRHKAEVKAAEYYPDARIVDDWTSLLDSDLVDVVDITLPTEHRAPVIEAALRAGKHVLSQKPFVADLDQGERLVQLAADQGVQLAVNQNGRWAPHMAWMRNAVALGLVGTVQSMHVGVHWNHGWTAGTHFDEIDDLILFDFGIHWFDFVASVIGQRAESVYAMAANAADQANKVPLLAQAMIRMSGGQASLVFDGATPHGPRDTSLICGTTGSIHAQGPDLGSQSIEYISAAGIARPDLQGTWFNDGFRGAMGELLCAIEDERAPVNSAKENLWSLAMVFAAVRSRATGKEVKIGEVRQLEV